MSEFYKSAKIAVVPINKGSGTRLKILEAMSFALPVVSTSKGAEGIDYTNDENIFATSIEKLINDEIYYNKISAQAKENFLINHEKSIVYHELDKVFN